MNGPFVTVHSVPSNTLRDAQKRQKMPLIVMKSPHRALFVASRRNPRVFCDFRYASLTKNTSRNTTCEQ